MKHLKRCASVAKQLKTLKDDLNVAKKGCVINMKKLQGDMEQHNCNFKKLPHQPKELITASTKLAGDADDLAQSLDELAPDNVEAYREKHVALQKAIADHMTQYRATSDVGDFLIAQRAQKEKNEGHKRYWPRCKTRADFESGTFTKNHADFLTNQVLVCEDRLL